MTYFFKYLILILTYVLEIKDCYKFPINFRFGAATSAYQIEGSSSIDGKGVNVWDEIVKNNPAIIADKTTTDNGPNSYKYYKRDIEILNELNFDFYRFSISWSRILPNGDLSEINQRGIDYYNNLINDLIENNIEPMITIFHWDLPQKFAETQGFLNHTIIEHFRNYCDILFKNYGNRVKRWITFNQPVDICTMGYGKGSRLGKYLNTSIEGGEYLCVHNLLKAHATVYHLYAEKYRANYEGKIGIALHSMYFYAKNVNDEEITNRGLQFSFGWLAHPLIIGDYPKIMQEQIKENSILEGFSQSRLPEFNEFWKNFIKGSIDFIGYNYYTSRFAETPYYIDDNLKSTYEGDRNLNLTVDENWKKGSASWAYSVPSGLTDMLRWIKNEYNNPLIWITENGWSDYGEIDDYERINYLRSHFIEILKSINLYHFNVEGYSVWSFIDNWEWFAGLTERLGLYHVDFESENKTRSPKKSSYFMKEIISKRKIDEFS